MKFIKYKKKEKTLRINIARASRVELFPAENGEQGFYWRYYASDGDYPLSENFATEDEANNWLDSVLK